MDSLLKLAFISEIVHVFERSSIPESLRTLAKDNQNLWTCFEMLYHSTQSLSTAIFEIKQTSKKVKAAIVNILTSVLESEKAIHDTFRHDLLVYVLSQVNRIPVSSIEGSKALLSITKIPNYRTFYDMIKIESEKLCGREKKARAGHEGAGSITSLEFCMDDTQGSLDFMFLEMKSLTIFCHCQKNPKLLLCHRHLK